MGASPLVRGYGRVAELRACLTARKAPGPAIPLCIAAGTADAEHGDARFQLAQVGNVSHVCSTIARAGMTGTPQ